MTVYQTVKVNAYFWLFLLISAYTVAWVLARHSANENAAEMDKQLVEQGCMRVGIVMTSHKARYTYTCADGQVYLGGNAE